ncbi:MAG TPA: redoxin domain-containing protein [Steroidobacteraceae bacterium]|nr:redoxin domain-containing protein [Steroidobacteraceae bacterium]
MNRKLWFGSLVAVSASLLMGVAQATMPGEVVADFKLADHTGKSRSLYEGDSTKPIVVMIQGNYCPIVRHAMPALKEVSAKYAPQGVRFLLLNSNIQDNRETIAKEVEEFGYPFPVLVDKNQKIGEALYVQRTSEVFVIDPKTKKLLYRGPMDDRLSYERQRPATKHYLTDALDAALAGQPVKLPYADGVGCIVNFPNRRTSQVNHASMGH